MDNEENEDI